MATQSVSFSVGLGYTWVVPAGVTSVTAELWGAAGEGGGRNGDGGLGGYLKCSFPVTPGESLQVNVGARGGGGQGASHASGMGTARGGNGGAASDIRRGGTALANRVAVAGGGGGTSSGGTGGGGGGAATGGAGLNYGGAGAGGGGTQAAGGAGGSAGAGGSSGVAGALGAGGNGGTAGGGGGGGYYGGGGGGGYYDGTFAGGAGGGGGSSYSSGTIITNTQGIQSGNGQVTLTYNTAPNAPTAQVASTIDATDSNVISAPFSDPDPGDTCSQTDFQWWDLDGTGARVGAAHTQTVTGAQPTQWTAPAGTFTNGNKEIQAKSYDALGVASPWGASAFFTAATPTGLPTITDPTNGATIGQTPYTVAWTTAGGQKGYQVSRVKDNAGSADATTVYWDSGQVTGAGADSVRSLSVPFETNGRYEHVQVSVTADGTLWSSWADARVLVSYTPPAAPTFTVDLDAASGSALITITNPAPGTGQPSSSYNIVETDDGDGKGFTTRPGSSMVAPNTAYRYWTPPSGFDPAGNVRVTAVATNGVTSSTTSPLNVTDGNSPANTTTTISDGGVVL